MKGRGNPAFRIFNGNEFMANRCFSLGITLRLGRYQRIRRVDETSFNFNHSFLH